MNIYDLEPLSDTALRDLLERVQMELDHRQKHPFRVVTIQHRSLDYTNGYGPRFRALDDAKMYCELHINSLSDFHDFQFENGESYWFFILEEDIFRYEMKNAGGKPAWTIPT